MKGIVFSIIFFLVSSSAYAASVTENFEGETIDGQTFSQGGYDFSVSQDFMIESFGSFGSGSSDYWLGTGSFNGGTSGDTGAININTANSYFTVTNFDGWTSDNDGANNFSGTVSFKGTEYITGNIFIASIYINPTGYTGADWDTGLNFSGTSLDGINLVSLSADLSGSPLNYLAIDNVVFDITTASPVPVPGAIWLLGSGLLFLTGVSRRKNRA